jgi:hypothetical protein
MSGKRSQCRIYSIVAKSVYLTRHAAEMFFLLIVNVMKELWRPWNSNFHHVLLVQWSTICFPPQGAAVRASGVQPTLWHWDYLLVPSRYIGDPDVIGDPCLRLHATMGSFTRLCADDVKSHL